MTEPFRVWSVRIAQLFVGALTFVVAVNLAILVYARTVTRLGEIAVRTALGASRRRILVQLFMEALALSRLVRVPGCCWRGSHSASCSRWSVEQLRGVLDRSRAVGGDVMYVIGLAVLAAVIMGVLPGLKATGRRVNANLRELDSPTGARLGPVWTTLVVAQVAVAVAVLPLAVYMSWQVVQMGLAGPEFAAEEFVVGIVAVSDESSATDRDRIRARQVELVSRLEAEPGVSAVTFSSACRGFRRAGCCNSKTARCEVHGSHGRRHAGCRPRSVRRVRRRDPCWAEFHLSDLGAANTVIVNRASSSNG